MNNHVKNMLKALASDENLMRVKLIKLKKKNVFLYNKLLENVKYKEQYVGKRCFILGNGPSLRDVNFEMLSEEYVFSVNNFSQVDNFQKVKTNFHLWMDFSFFGLREDQKYDMDVLLKNYHSIAEEKPICFFPIEAYDFVKNNHLDNILNVNYLMIHNIVSENNMIHGDISKLITTFTTVIQYAIVIAVYMGFSEIYLLGCDTTNIVSLINCALEKNNNDMHAYDNDDTNERYKELLKHWDMTDVFYDQYLLFLGYKRLAEFCKNKKVKLVNCSTNTLINEIARERIENVIL